MFQKNAEIMFVYTIIDEQADVVKLINSYTVLYG